MEINQEYLDRVQTAVMVVFSKRFDIDESTIAFEDSISHLSKGNPYLLGHALLDIHEFLKIEKIELPEPIHFFDVFKSVEDVVKFFYATLVQV